MFFYYLLLLAVNVHVHVQHFRTYTNVNMWNIKHFLVIITFLKVRGRLFFHAQSQWSLQLLILMPMVCTMPYLVCVSADSVIVGIFHVHMCVLLPNKHNTYV